MTATEMTRVPLDGRVINAEGRPVPRFRLPWARGWFTLARAPGADGVVLAAHIPGYLSGVTRHDDQAAAELAAREIYDTYKAAVIAAAAGQETGT